MKGSESEWVKTNTLSSGFYIDVCYTRGYKVTVICCWLVRKNCGYVVGNSSGLILVIKPTFLLSDWWKPRKSFPRLRLLNLWPPINESCMPTTRHEYTIREGKIERANDLSCFVRVPQDVCTCCARPFTATVLWPIIYFALSEAACIAENNCQFLAVQWTAVIPFAEKCPNALRAAVV